MKRMLILILIAGLAIAGGGFYFIQKAEKLISNLEEVLRLSKNDEL